jgi:hypothetical protein
LGAEKQEARKAPNSRHVEIEENEVALAIGLERGGQTGEITRFLDADRGVAAAQRLAQRSPK